MSESCWHEGCTRFVCAELEFRGQVVLTCWKHHPFRKRLFVLRNLRHLGVLPR